MTIHKEGIRIILFSLLIVHLLEFFIFGYVYSFVPHFVSYVLAIIPLIFFLLILQFFRIPSRKVDFKDGTVLCPADGKIVAIEEVEETEYFKGKRIQVSIFMSPLNVHANYYPISGKVKYVKYHPGLFLVAWHPKSSTDNERTTVVVEDNKEREVLFRQIAGAVARRICLYAEKDRTITAGSEFGFIKFGSRVDVFLPLGTQVNVELDELVKGKITKLATFN